MTPRFRKTASAAFSAILIGSLSLTAAAQPVEQVIKERIKSAQDKVDRRVEEARARAEQASADCRNASGSQTNSQIRRGNTSGLSQTQSGNCNSQSAVIGQPAR